MKGFFDIHTHGAIGFDVNTATPEQILQISDFFGEHNVAYWLPTIMTSTEESMIKAIKNTVEAMKYQRTGAKIVGIHMEGPCLNSKYAGAMPPSQLVSATPAFIERLQKAADGTILRMTVAPEVEGVIDTIEAFGDSIAFSLGHSDATYDLAQKAIKAGARSITHTCNAMRLFHMHEPGLLGAAIDSDVYCEIIADGIHIVPSAVRVLLKAIGKERIMMITDSMSAAGMGDGEFILGTDNKVIVRNGDALLASNGVRAGSVLVMDKGFENIKKFTGLSDEEIIPMFGQNQAKMLRLNLD